MCIQGRQSVRDPFMNLSSLTLEIFQVSILYDVHVSSSVAHTPVPRALPEHVASIAAIRSLAA